MKKTYIHVGLHKTASTWLQEKVFNDYPNLDIISRPYTELSKTFGKLHFANDEVYSKNDLLKDIELIHDPNKDLLISDENFSGLPYFGYLNRTMIANRLSEAFPEAEIILVLRKPLALMKSLYQQGIRTGWQTNSINEKFLWKSDRHYTWQYHKECLNSKLDWSNEYRYFDYFHTLVFDHLLCNNLVSLYEKRFPKVHVLLFEELVQNPSQFIEKLNKVLDSAPLRAPEFNVQINEKLTIYDRRKFLIKNKVNNLNLRSRFSRFLVTKIISATTPSAKDIQHEINEFNFDESNQATLYADLNELAQRREDIPLLQYGYLEKPVNTSRLLH